jgi:hypothetical protein
MLRFHVMREIILNRRLGWASIVLSLFGAFVFRFGAFVFRNAYMLAATSPSRLDAALNTGKIAILLEFIAAAVGGLGIGLDRHKILGMAGALLGLILVGFFGMLVYNI